MNRDKTVRIAGVQGFYGDSPMGAMAIAMAGAADYLMQDALSELTLSILQKDKLRDPNMGYARDIELLAKRVYPLALSKGMRIVTNSGGLNPQAAAQKVQAILQAQGLEGIKIAAIDGDDLFDQLDQLKTALPLENLDSGEQYKDSPYPATHANVYIGAQCIKDALDQGADIILAGRVADPCLALGILAHEFNWPIEQAETQAELDQLANGIMVGHIIECGGQASGGNAYSEWEGREYDFWNLGYPIAQVKADGSATITKVEGSGGRVSQNTIREQLVYEIHNPKAYITPDVVVDFSEIYVKEVAENQVEVGGAKGAPKPEQLKLCIGQHEGYLTEQLFYFSYPYALAKAEAFVKAAKNTWAILPFEYEELRINYLGIDGVHEGAAPRPAQEVIEAMNEVGVRLAIRHQDKATGKRMIQSIIALGLNGPPGIAASMNWGKAGSMRLGLFPTLISRDLVEPKIKIYT